jgi:hypothetical protein
MYSVIRHYAGAPSLADELTKRKGDVEKEISGVPGFVSYYLLKTADGAIAITLCESRQGCEESSRRAANWLRQNLPNAKIPAPQILSGEVTIKFASKTAKV